MAIWGLMPWICNCCGKKMYTTYNEAMGRNWRVCSFECLREMDLREANSIMGKDYPILNKNI